MGVEEDAGAGTSGCWWKWGLVRVEVEVEVGAGAGACLVSFVFCFPDFPCSLYPAFSVLFVLGFASRFSV